jgi:hypothetical protein
LLSELDEIDRRFTVEPNTSGAGEGAVLRQRVSSTRGRFIMAVARLLAPETGALRCILYSIVDRRSTFLVTLSFYYLLSVAGIAADVQVNSPDHNVSNQADLTSQNEPSVAVFGLLVVVGYNSTRQAGLNSTEQSCLLRGLDGRWNSLNGYAYSTNGGLTFTDGGFVPANGKRLTGDPALAFGPNGTTLYYASMGTDADRISRIFVTPSTSLSPSVTFGVPVAISGLTSGTGPLQDKEFIAVDTTESSFRGRVYVAWSEFPDENTPAPDGPSRVLFAASSPTTALEFSPTRELSPVITSPVTKVNYGAMPAVAPNGDLYVIWGVFTPSTPPEPPPVAPQTIQIVRSTNGGANFHNPDPADANPSKTIASVTSTVGRMCDATGTPPSCRLGLNVRTRGLPHLAIDHTPPGSPTRGNIYVVFQAKPLPPATARSQIFFTRSTDGGKTWDMPRSISNGPAVTNGDATQHDNWMPSIAVSPVTGHIRVIFYSRREDPHNIDIRVYDAGSTDGGLTWFNRPRSTTAFKPSTGYYDTLLQFRLKNGVLERSERGEAHMGDYISVVAAGSNFYAAWTDTRNACAPPRGASCPCSQEGRGDQDVFFSTDEGR